MGLRFVDVDGAHGLLRRTNLTGLSLLSRSSGIVAAVTWVGTRSNRGASRYPSGDGASIDDRGGSIWPAKTATPVRSDMTDAQRPLVGVTLGDPAGVGPEISLQALREPSVYEQTRPLVIGDRIVVEKAARALGFE